MKRLLKSFLSAAFLTVLAGAGQSFAFEQVVNNIWWAVYENYNWSDQTACIAENNNDHAVVAAFELFPTSFDAYGRPRPSRTVLTMMPHQTYKLYSWANVPGPGPRCQLLSSIPYVP